MNLLGHKSPKHTLKYVHIDNTVCVEDQAYSCKTPKIMQEAASLIESGFEYVTEMDGIKLFRKRK